jgi:dihydroxyacetone kinase-like predicted kinase
MFLLHADRIDDHRFDAFRTTWASVGDSVVIVGGPNPDGGGLWNCHIHTDDIGAAIEAALDIGRPSQIRVTDLAAQVTASRPCGQPASGAATPSATPSATAVVAVANGAGLVSIMRAQGASQVVVGGQGSNPSTGQLVAAVEACRADGVVLLPDNPNIVAVANQVAAALGEGPPQVVVVPTRSVVAGMAALTVCDPDASASDNAAAMQIAADSVVAAEITRAIRASTCDGGPIAVGDWLGVADGVVEVVGTDPVDVVVKLVGRLVHDHHELVTVFAGEDSDQLVTASVERALGDVHPQLVIEVHHGGQPLYPYLIGLE